MLRLLGLHLNPFVRIVLAAALVAVGIGAHLYVLAAAGGVVLVWSAAQVVTGAGRSNRDDRTESRRR